MWRVMPTSHTTSGFRHQFRPASCLMRGRLSTRGGVQEEVLAVPESDRPIGGDRQFLVGRDVGDAAGHGGGVNCPRLFTTKSQQHAAHGAVPSAGEREGAIEIDPDASELRQCTGAIQFIHKSTRGSHWTDGVGIGWADAGPEDIEEAGFHEGPAQCAMLCSILASESVGFARPNFSLRKSTYNTGSARLR